MQGTLANFLSTPTKRNGLLGLAAVAAITFYVVEVAAPRWRDESLRQSMSEIREENKSLCEGLGFDSGSPQRARCEEGAALIREKQAERSQAEAWGAR